MPTGRVKWFSDTKGYGFIRADGSVNGGKDIFVHWSEIVLEGFKTLVQGQAVTFELTDTPRGLQAKHVGILESAPTQSTPEPRDVDPE